MKPIEKSKSINIKRIIKTILYEKNDFKLQNVQVINLIRINIH